MLLFHRPFTGTDEILPFAVSTAGMSSEDARKLIIDRPPYNGSGEFIDCSDLEQNLYFYTALENLRNAVGTDVETLLSAEFTYAIHQLPKARNTHPLKYLDMRALGTNFYPVVDHLLEHCNDELRLVINAIHQRGYSLRKNIHTQGVT